MSNANNCAECFGHRWQYYAARFKDDKLLGEWRQFDRGSWSLLGAQDLATMLAAKTLRPCKACNAEKRLAPWSKTWREDAAPAPAQNGGSNDVPF